jgi:hypothetical protein
LARRYILAGQSHAFSLGLPNPLPSAAPAIDPVDGLNGSVLGLTGGSPRQPSYWDALVANAEDTTVLLIWNGNQHLARFLFQTGAPFDFHLAAHPGMAVSSEAAIVPESLVREVLEEGNSMLRPVAARLRAVKSCSLVLLGTPPPKGNDRRLRSILPKDLHFVRAARELGVALDDIEFTDRIVRLKLWMVVQDLLSEAAGELGCKFVSVPTETMDEMGFLREDLWREDITHANHRYGEVFWSNSFEEAMK